MASKEAKSDATAAEPAAAAAPSFAFELKLLKDKIGEKTTNKQVKAKVTEAFMGYGAFDECKVVGEAGADRTVIVFFARLFGKGQPSWDALSKGEKSTITIYDEVVELGQSDAKPSGGGATTGTSFLPKKESPKGEKKGGRGRGRGRGEGEGMDGEGKDGEGKDGGRGRGRGRGKKPEEVKGPSLQRGRANIGGKVGQMSKVRLAKIEKEKKAKEIADRIAKGEKVEDIKKEDEPKEEPAAAPKKGGKEEKGKGEAGKKDAGKKEGGKKEAGKAEAGKKDAGKKEGAKAEGGKKEAAKKGK